LNGWGANLAWLLLAGLYMAFVTGRALRERTLGWRISALIAWVALFIVLAFLADRIGLQAPSDARPRPPAEGIEPKVGKQLV